MEQEISDAFPPSLSPFPSRPKQSTTVLPVYFYHTNPGANLHTVFPSFGGILLVLVLKKESNTTLTDQSVVQKGVVI